MGRALATGFASRGVLIALAVVLAAALLAVLLRTPPLPVAVHSVRAEPFVEAVVAQGRTRLRERYTVSAPITGYLRRVTPEPGDAVQLGQGLFEIEPLPTPALDARARSQAEAALQAAQARYRAAQAERDNLQADLRLADSEFRRQEQLYAQQLISETQMDRLVSARDRARSALRAAEARVAASRSDRDYARLVLDVADGIRDPDARHALVLTAPIAGQVLHRHRCCEGPVQAGEPVLELGDLDELEVRVEVLSADAVKIRNGMRVLIDGWGGEPTLEGRVRRVEPAGFTKVSALGVEEQRVPVAVALETPRANWAGLGDGFRVDVRVVLWEADAVLQVPSNALFRRDERWSVFVVEDGRARLRTVGLGRRSGLRTQILAGLQAGESVIIHPDARIDVGTRVRVE
jgi:HlyD family secretion protein